jgi:type II secretory pathway pseudopilin PulG
MMPFKKQQNSFNSSESGYTIIEGLIAVLIVSFLATAIGPMIAFAAGTRMQAKRVELAAQAGRTYIDGIKSGAVTPSANPNSTRLKDVNAPASGNLACDASKYCTAPETNLYCVDFDSTGQCESGSQVDMLVQASACHPTSTQLETGYYLGIRVYRANSFDSGVGQLQTTPPSTNITNALGDRTLPLVTITTEVSPEEGGFSDLQERLSGASTCISSN